MDEFLKPQNTQQIVGTLIRFFYEKMGVKVLDRLLMEDIVAETNRVKDSMRVQEAMMGKTLRELNGFAMSAIKAWINEGIKVDKSGTVPPMPGSGEVFDVGIGGLNGASVVPSVSAEQALSSDDLLSDEEFQAKLRMLDSSRAETESYVVEKVVTVGPVCIMGSSRPWMDEVSRNPFGFRLDINGRFSGTICRVNLPSRMAACPFVHMKIDKTVIPLMWQQGSYVPLTAKLGLWQCLDASAGIRVSFHYPDGDVLDLGKDGMTGRVQAANPALLAVSGGVDELNEFCKYDRLVLKSRKTGRETKHNVVEISLGNYPSERRLIIEPFAEPDEYSVLSLKNQVLIYIEPK